MALACIHLMFHGGGFVSGQPSIPDAEAAAPAHCRVVEVKLLYFEDCPSYEELLPTLRELLASEGIKDEVEVRRVETPEEAEFERFLGSPTVRINGEDVDPAASDRHDYGMECRLYRTDQGLVRTPPEEWIRGAVEAAR